MLLADQEKSCEALRRERRTCLEASANHQGTLAELAALEQRIAQLQEQELVAATRLADGAVILGRRLFEILFNIAQGGRLHGQGLDPAGAAALFEWTQSRPASLERQARTFVIECARCIAYCQQGIAESLESDDLETARGYCKQAGRMVEALREIEGCWPWTDQAAALESLRQYQRGELMDFETFKHELLKAAQ